MTIFEASSALPGFPAVPAADMKKKVVAGLVTHLEPAAFWLQRDPDKAQDMADILASGEEIRRNYHSTCFPPSLPRLPPRPLQQPPVRGLPRGGLLERGLVPRHRHPPSAGRPRRALRGLRQHGHRAHGLCQSGAGGGTCGAPAGRQVGGGSI